MSRQRRKNITLMLVLAVMLGLTALAAWYEPGLPPGTRAVAREMQLQGAELLDGIEIDGPQQISLQKVKNGWRLNGQYRADDQVLQLLLNVLTRVEVQRPVAEQELPEISEYLQREGARVTLLEGSIPVRELRVAGRQSDGTTWMQEEGTETIYRMQIPGYTDYLASIFFLTENQWRDRRLFQTDWQTLRSLEIRYPARPGRNVRIEHQGGFPTVVGLEVYNREALEQYLQGYAGFGVDGIIGKGEYPYFDALIRPDNVLAHLLIDDLNPIFSREVMIYNRGAEQDYYPAVVNGQDTVVIASQRLLPFLVQQSDFRQDQAPSAP